MAVKVEFSIIVLDIELVRQELCSFILSENPQPYVYDAEILDRYYLNRIFCDANSNLFKLTGYQLIGKDWSWKALTYGWGPGNSYALQLESQNERISLQDFKVLINEMADAIFTDEHAAHARSIVQESDDFETLIWAVEM